jgi:hypothetical protein
MMHGREKSDSAIVAGKPTNKAVSTAAEPVERRAEAKGNASQQSTRWTQSRVSVSQALERIRQAVTKNALPSHTQGGSRMPELGPYGSVRGALSNERPYRDLRNVAAKYAFERAHGFPEIQPNSGHRDYSRLSCGAGETQLGLMSGSQQAVLRGVGHRAASLPFCGRIRRAACDRKDLGMCFKPPAHLAVWLPASHMTVSHADPTGSMTPWRKS